MTTLSVQTVQQGLTAVARDQLLPDVPSPGAIDGVGGPATKRSLSMFIWAIARQAEAIRPGSLATANEIVVSLNDIPARSRTIEWGVEGIPSGQAALLQNAVGMLTEAAQRPSAIQPVLDQASSVVAQSRPFGTSPVLPIVLGLGAAGLLVGLGYLYFRSRKGGGRRLRRRYA